MPLKNDYIRGAIAYLNDSLALVTNEKNLPLFRGYVSLSMDMLHEFEVEYRNPFEEKYPISQPFKGVDETIDILERVRNFEHRRQVQIGIGLLYEALEELPPVKDQNQVQILNEN